MARNSYKMKFKDKTVVFSQEHNSDVSYRVLNNEEMEIMQLLLMDMEESTFSCNEEEFVKSVFTPHYLEMLRTSHLNRFRIKKV